MDNVTVGSSRDADFLRWYCDEGMSMGECGERVGVSREWVRLRLKEHGVNGTTHGPRISGRQRERIVIRYENTDETIATVARVAGVHAHTAAKILRDADVEVDGNRGLRGVFLPEYRQALIVEAYRAGRGFAWIRDNLGHGNQTAKKVLLKWGVRVRGNGERADCVTPEERAQFKWMREDGESISYIARAFGRAPRTVKRHLAIASAE